MEHKRERQTLKRIGGGGDFPQNFVSKSNSDGTVWLEIAFLAFYKKNSGLLF